MEHEIIGHTKKAYKIMKSPNKHFWEKAKEILIEVLIIVFAVTFAALIERTREHYKEKAEAKEFLMGLKGDIKNELTEVQDDKKDMDTVRINYGKLFLMQSSSIDSVVKNKIQIGFNISKFGSRLANGRYDGFKSSGKIQTIEDDSLRNDILKLYEEDIPYLNFAESAFNANQTRIEDFVIDNADGNTQNIASALKLLTGGKSKLLLKFSLGYSDAVLNGYTKITKDIKKIQAEIDNEYQ